MHLYRDYYKCLDGTDMEEVKIWPVDINEWKGNIKIIIGYSHIWNPEQKWTFSHIGMC